MKKTIVKILKSLRSFDEDTFMHSIRVMQISLKIGEKMGLPKSQLHELAISAMLHDIGKEEIPKNVLFKNGKLSEEEFSLVKKHVKSGYVKVKYLNIPENSKTSIMYHHENENGTGYFGKKGDEIKDLAALIHICDDYENKLRIYANPIVAREHITVGVTTGLYKKDLTISF